MGRSPTPLVRTTLPPWRRGPHRCIRCGDNDCVPVILNVTRYADKDGEDTYHNTEHKPICEPCAHFLGSTLMDHGAHVVGYSTYPLRVRWAAWPCDVDTRPRWLRDTSRKVRDIIWG
jgi:hypothetical protein